MLQTIRDRSQGVIVAVVIGLVSLTFVLWGVESYISAARQVVVAEVEGQDIPLEEFQQHLQRQRRQAEAMMGEAFDAEAWNSPEFKRRALDALVDERLLDILTDGARVRVADAQVARQLADIPAFQEDGRFSRQLFEQRVSSLGYSPLGFEQRLRADMRQAQLRGGIAASEFVLREEAERTARLSAQTRDIGYAVIPAQVVAAAAEVGDSDLETYFAAHQEDYRTVEKVEVEYLELSAAMLASAVAVDDAALRAFYDANHALYTKAEQRNVNHILIHVAENAPEAEVAAARAKAEAALGRARAGEDFEKLAAELSDDTGSKAEGGETGLFPRGVMAPEFEEAAFKLAAPGDLTEPVRTRFGFHLIKLKEIDAGGLQSFDAVRADVETAYRGQEAQKLYVDQAEQFSNLVYEHPEGLETAAEALGLTTQRTDALDRAALTERFSAAAADAAFSPEVLQQGLNSEPFEMPDGRVVALRAVEHHPAAIPPLAEVREAVREAVIAERQRELTAKAGEELITALRAGGSVSELLKDRGYDWQSVAGAGRASDKVNRAVLRAAFDAEVEDGEPLYLGLPVGVSDYAVVRVANVVTPVAAQVDKAEVDKLRQSLAGDRANQAWKDFVAALRARSDVEVSARDL